MRTRLFAVLAIPIVAIVAIACGSGTMSVEGSRDSGTGSEGTDASYGADDAGSGSDSGSMPHDSGSLPGIDSGVTDSGGGGGGSLVTPGGDCIGNPGASAGAGYDFECEFDESFDDDEPCTPDAGAGAVDAGGCKPDYCCFTNKSSMCYAGYGYQCVAYQ